MLIFQVSFFLQFFNSLLNFSKPSKSSNSYTSLLPFSNLQSLKFSNIYKKEKNPLNFEIISNFSIFSNASKFPSFQFHLSKPRKFLSLPLRVQPPHSSHSCAPYLQIFPLPVHKISKFAEPRPPTIPKLRNIAVYA